MRLKNVFRAHEGLANVLITLIDDLNFDAVMEGEQAVKRTGRLVKELVSNQLVGLSQRARTAQIQTHLIASLMSEGRRGEGSQRAMQPIRRSLFQTLDPCFCCMAAQAHQDLEDEGSARSLDALLALGRGREQRLYSSRPGTDRQRHGAGRVISRERQKIQKQLDASGFRRWCKKTESGMKGGTERSFWPNCRSSRHAAAWWPRCSAAGRGRRDCVISTFSAVSVRRLTYNCDRRCKSCLAGDNTRRAGGARMRDELGDIGRARHGVPRDAAVEKRDAGGAVAPRRSASMVEEERCATRPRARRPRARWREVVDGLGARAGAARAGRPDLSRARRLGGEYHKIQRGLQQRHRPASGHAVVRSWNRPVKCRAHRPKFRPAPPICRSAPRSRPPTSEETSASMEEIAATVKKNAENAAARQRSDARAPRGGRPRRRRGGARRCRRWRGSSSPRARFPTSSR